MLNLVEIRAAEKFEKDPEWRRGRVRADYRKDIALESYIWKPDG